jgi:preprotein translocase subunit SecA
MPSSLLRPGIRLGGYPQKKESDLTGFEQQAAVVLQKICWIFNRHRLNQQRIVKQVERHEQGLNKLSEEQLTRSIQALREELSQHGLNDTLIARAFAIIRETSGRTLGKRHFEAQLMGGWIMAHGMLAEMATGEGKTLTTTLPACTAALAGIPVHVITANDYLAARDAEILTPLYHRLGLTSGAVIEGMNKETRQQVYQCHIVHTTNKQIAFDYLRDRLEMGNDSGLLTHTFQQLKRGVETGSATPILLRGLCFALIDEADSVLIDEAKTPLIITKTIPNEESPDTYSDALYLGNSLSIKDDYTVDFNNRDIQFSQKGEEKLGKNVAILPKLWQNKRKREFLVKKALIAQLFYQKGKQYVVQDNKVQIVDEFTGRIMADRSWEQGLHQMIEAKEGCVITEQRQTLARISYQVFFSRYLRLAGTSGTLKEVKSEMHSIYGLQTLKVPTHKLSKMHMMQERIYRTTALKRKCFLERVAEFHSKGRPILIGTASIADSEEVSSWLQQDNYPHQVLNATQDKNEAGIIAKAGLLKAITVATNMAGRGTDIALGPGVYELGGLHVIALNSNESRRIDRQLYGRSARQGDPGSVEAILSLEDPGFSQFYSSAMLKFMSQCCLGSKPMPDFLARIVLRLPQNTKEKQQRRQRKQVMDNDKQLGRMLSFTGKFE